MKPTFKELKVRLDSYLDHPKRKTPQRYSVLEEICLYNKDFTADDLYVFMREKGYKLSPASIYNILGLFLSINIITSLNQRKYC